VHVHVQMHTCGTNVLHKNVWPDVRIHIHAAYLAGEATDGSISSACRIAALTWSATRTAAVSTSSAVVILPTLSRNVPAANLIGWSGGGARIRHNEEAHEHRSMISVTCTQQQQPFKSSEEAA
jgi:hypothetical protein